jgi:hypothetical protein
MAVDVKPLVVTGVGVLVGTAVVDRIARLLPTYTGKLLGASAITIGSLIGAEHIREENLSYFVRGIGWGGLALIALSLYKRFTGVSPLPPELTPEEEELLGLTPPALPEEKILAEELLGVPPEVVSFESAHASELAQQPTIIL